MNKAIGILGDIGSGKSFVAQSFGYPVFDADREVSKLYKADKKTFNKLKKILNELVSPAERNFNDKAKRLTNREIIPVWQRAKKNDGIFYSVNRNHPLITE